MKLAINGYGRIGRCILRAASLRDECSALEFIAINELATHEAIAYLTRYDSTHGRFPGEIGLRDGRLTIKTAVNNFDVALLSCESPRDAQWQSRDIDLVLDCTGALVTPELAGGHLQSGASRVLLSYPGDSSIPAIVYGVNHSALKADDKVVSSASCTSNALIPPLKILNDHFLIKHGVITTVHASMHDQPVIDAYHSDDLRKNRAASQSIIPVDTALASGVARILPALAGKFIAHAIRVPVNNVSALNITVTFEETVDAKTVNEVLQQASVNELAGIMGYTSERLASCDFLADPRSCVVDALQTDVVDGHTANLLVWFDNEWAFANRMLDTALLMSRQ